MTQKPPNSPRWLSTVVWMILLTIIVAACVDWGESVDSSLTYVGLKTRTSTVVGEAWHGASPIVITKRGFEPNFYAIVAYAAVCILALGLFNRRGYQRPVDAVESQG